MKIFTVSSNHLLYAKQYVLDRPSVYGVTIILPMTNFLGGMTGKFNESFMTSLKTEIRRINSAGKKVALGVMFGNMARNIPGIDYLGFIEAGHQGGDTPQGISVPIYQTEKYFDYLESFVQWFSGSLKDEQVEQIKMTGINQNTAELRVPDQDFTGGDAFENAALKWRATGYHPEITYQFVMSLVELFKYYFADKTIAIPIISGLAGFPCIDYNGNVCGKKKRPDLSRKIIDTFCSQNVAPQWTALDIANTPPDYVYGSKSADIIYQVASQTWKQPTAPYSEFEKVIANGEKHNGTILELFDTTLLAYPEL